MDTKKPLFKSGFLFIINYLSVIDLWRMKTKKTYLKEEFDKDDMMDVVKRDKNFEKRIKEITTDVVVDLFRVLWQRRSSYESEIKR